MVAVTLPNQWITKSPLQIAPLLNIFSMVSSSLCNQKCSPLLTTSFSSPVHSVPASCFPEAFIFNFLFSSNRMNQTKAMWLSGDCHCMSCCFYSWVCFPSFSLVLLVHFKGRFQLWYNRRGLSAPPDLFDTISWRTSSNLQCGLSLVDSITSS